MRENAKMGEKREGEHGDGNRQTNWERVFDNVASEAVFDALGVMF